MAKQSLGGDARPFKAWLRKAENARRDALRLKEQGDLEPAFAEFTKAVTILLEKIPSHSDYRVLLTLTQRHNIRLVSYLHAPVPRFLVPRQPCGYSSAYIDKFYP